MSVYRWERDLDSYHEDGGMVLRTDNNEPQTIAYAGQYWHDARLGEWNWMAHGRDMRLIDEGECATADEARRACELAVLHGDSRPCDE